MIVSEYSQREFGAWRRRYPMFRDRRPDLLRATRRCAGNGYDRRLVECCVLNGPILRISDLTCARPPLGRAWKRLPRNSNVQPFDSGFRVLRHSERWPAH